MRDDLPESYWDKQEQMKEAMQRMKMNSNTSWWQLYHEEKGKREALELKLEKQVASTNYFRRLAELAMRDTDEAEFGKLVQQRLDEDEEGIRVDLYEDEEKEGM